MADSNITKRALAAALKELMEKMPFSKISVSDICGKCNMNRKSFYYHFRDKYDLVNWIFDIDFLQIVSAQQLGSNQPWSFLEELCNYFYENRTFYRHALLIEGQNSFVGHFREMLEPVLRVYLKDILKEPQYVEFHIQFYSDALIGSTERWLCDKESMPPEQFLKMLHSCVDTLVKYAESQGYIAVDETHEQ